MAATADLIVVDAPKHVEGELLDAPKPRKPMTKEQLRNAITKQELRVIRERNKLHFLIGKCEHWETQPGRFCAICGQLARDIRQPLDN